MKARNRLLKLIFSSIFLTLAFVLPFLTGQIPKIGSMLCPMHIPVMLCGFICGWPWGMTIGLISPILRSAVLGVPILFPNALYMAFELCTYGLVCGLMYKYSPQKRRYIYLSLVIAIIVGRIVLSVAKALLLGAGFVGFFTFLVKAFTTAIPGILIQIILVPFVVMLSEKLKIIRKNGLTV